MIFGQTTVEVVKVTNQRRWEVYSTTLTPQRLLCVVPWGDALRTWTDTQRAQYPDYYRAVAACTSHPDTSLTVAERRLARGEDVDVDEAGQDRSELDQRAQEARAYLRVFFDEQAEYLEAQPVVYCVADPDRLHGIAGVFAVPGRRTNEVEVLTQHFRAVLRVRRVRAQTGRARVHLAYDGTPLESGAVTEPEESMPVAFVWEVLRDVFGDDASRFRVLRL